MVVSEDVMSSFVPRGKTQFVILGTMVAICARKLDQVSPSSPSFYYHNNRNHFWRVLQHLMDPQLEVPKKQMSIQEKKSFLNQHGIAITNLVQKIQVPNSEAHDPSDTILFKAHKKKRLQFKAPDPKAKKILEKSPLFFTCRHKKGIADLVDGYWQANGLSPESKKRIWYLATPTRCNPKARAEMWRSEMREWGLKLEPRF